MDVLVSGPFGFLLVAVSPVGPDVPGLAEASGLFGDENFGFSGVGVFGFGVVFGEENFGFSGGFGATDGGFGEGLLDPVPLGGFEDEDDPEEGLLLDELPDDGLLEPPEGFEEPPDEGLLEPPLEGLAWLS